MSNRNRLLLCSIALLLSLVLSGCGLLAGDAQETAAVKEEGAVGEAAVVEIEPEPQTVTIGGTEFPLATQELTLPAATTAEELALLSRFTGLTSVDGSACACYEALAKLALEKPDTAFSWQGEVCGVTVKSGDETADFTAATGFDADALLTALPSFPNLKTLDLTGLTLTDGERDKLMAAAPEASFLWSVQLYGVTVSSGDTELDLSNKAIDNPAELVQKLAYLPALTKVDLCNTGLTDQQMEELMAGHPAVKFVWMIRVGGWEMRTDVKAFSKGNRKTFEGGSFVGGKTDLTTEDIQPLRYCTEMVALDLGHSRKLTDISVIENMPKLRFLIVAMTGITNISSIEKCPELQYVETFQNYLEDLSPLLTLKKLTHLNCSTNIPKDKSKRDACAEANFALLMQMTGLKRLWCIRDGFSKEQIAQLKSALPDCEINTTGVHSTSNGWRDNDLYEEMQGLFNLSTMD